MTKNVIAAIGTRGPAVDQHGLPAPPTPPRTPAASTPAPAPRPRVCPTACAGCATARSTARLALQTYRVPPRASPRPRRAADRPGSWAVVLDADETIISNLQYQIERARPGYAYSSESWRAWVARREATPLPGAADFLARVRALGGRIAIVTNRLESECCGY